MYMYVTYIIHVMGAQPTRVLLLRNPGAQFSWRRGQIRKK